MFTASARPERRPGRCQSNCKCVLRKVDSDHPNHGSCPALRRFGQPPYGFWPEDKHASSTNNFSAPHLQRLQWKQTICASTGVSPVSTSRGDSNGSSTSPPCAIRTIRTSPLTPGQDVPQSTSLGRDLPLVTKSWHSQKARPYTRIHSKVPFQGS
jgi:hypothetical protein